MSAPSTGGAVCSSLWCLRCRRRRRSAAAARASRSSPERGVLDADQQSLGPGLLPFVNFADRANSSGGDADSVELRLATRRCECSANTLWTSLVDLLLVRDALGVGLHPCGIRDRGRSPAQNRCHRPSLPTAICTLPSAVSKSPYGQIDGWWLPWPRRPRRPRSTWCLEKHAPRRRWQAARTARPGHARCARVPAVRRATPNAPYMPASRSAIGTPTR